MEQKTPEEIKAFEDGWLAKRRSLTEKLSTAKELIKELLPLAQENAEGRCSISDSYRHRAQIIVEKAKQFVK